MPGHHLHLSLFFFLISLPLTFSLNSDGLSLLAFKAAISVDPTGALATWTDTSLNPCTWAGVTCKHNHVTQLTLPSKALTGYLPSELGFLAHLKRLSLPHNNLSHAIPTTLFNATTLLVLDLSHNGLTGPLPASLSYLKSLVRLDLSSNLLSGHLPVTLSSLPSLSGTLNLSHNLFTGDIPSSLGSLPIIISLDLRFNNLTGEIPQVGSLLNQGPTAFSNNPYLCGFPLQNTCPENPKVPTTKQRQNPNRDLQTGEQNPRGGGLFVCVVAMVVISGVLLCFAVVFMILRRGRCDDEGQFGKVECGNVGCVDDLKGRFVVVEEEGGELGGMELEDLLRGSAYVVGKSRSGIVYKVVGVGKGAAAATVVAVRRLGEGGATWRLKEFEAEVEGMARVRHPNVVALRAYYYAREEKLLVTDFIRNGNLQTALHGGPSNSFSPLPWAARLKIAQGAARGLTYIHGFSGRKYVHGNLKSTKILLDEDHDPYISGFGLTRLGIGSSNSKSPSSAPKRLSSNHFIATSTIVSVGSNVSASSYIYLAPEARIAGGKFTQKCDVYSFGIVLLELLTGRLPDLGAENDGMELESFVRKAFREEQPLSDIIDPALLPEVYAKKQVIAVFHVALNCTELDPELRPKMRTLSETLDRIKLQ